MDRGEFFFKLSAEGREWAKLLHIPALFAFITWHLPQPRWLRRVLLNRAEKNECPNSDSR